METNEKLMTLLRLMDEPESMTEAQLQELLADDEVREAYELMAECKRGLWRMKNEEMKNEECNNEEMNNEEMNNEKCKLPLEDEGKAATHRSNSYFSFFTHSFFIQYRVAAIFLVAAFLGGLAWAIGGHLLTSPKGEEPQPPQVTSNPLPLGGGREGASSPQRFSNTRLDSILTIVSEHYGKTVRYRNEEPRSMKLITTWNPTDSLSVFIEHLNMFDYLHLTLRSDTIFVEQTSGEEGK